MIYGIQVKDEMKHTIDLLSQVCIYVDYPLWRTWVKKYRSKFNKVILYASRHHGVIDLEEFWRKELPETWVSTEIDWTTPNIDWREVETLPLLEQSNAQWILFMEADFFCDDWDKLWADIEREMDNGAEMIGWWNETSFSYMHPCFLLIKRELLDKTNKDFRAHPEIPGCDHFAMITHDVQELGAKIVKLQDLGWKDWENAFHGGGYTYPLQNWKGDRTDHFGVASPEAYYTYLYWARQAPVGQSSEYIELSLEVEERLKELFPIFKPGDNRWVKFFK